MKPSRRQLLRFGAMAAIAPKAMAAAPSGVCTTFEPIMALVPRALVVAASPRHWGNLMAAASMFAAGTWHMEMNESHPRGPRCELWIDMTTEEMRLAAAPERADPQRTGQRMSRGLLIVGQVADEYVWMPPVERPARLPCPLCLAMCWVDLANWEELRARGFRLACVQCWKARAWPEGWFCDA